MFVTNRNVTHPIFQDQSMASWVHFHALSYVVGDLFEVRKKMVLTFTRDPVASLFTYIHSGKSLGCFRNEELLPRSTYFVKTLYLTVSAWQSSNST